MTALALALALASAPAPEMTALGMAAPEMAAPYPSLCKTPLGETGCLGNHIFTYWLPKHPIF